jgi:hypothetical protein
VLTSREDEIARTVEMGDAIEEMEHKVIHQILFNELC